MNERMSSQSKLLFSLSIRRSAWFRIRSEENISEFLMGTTRPRQGHNAQRSSADGVSPLAVPNGDPRRERPSAGPVAAPFGLGSRTRGRSRSSVKRGILFGIHCDGGTATMNKGAAAAREVRGKGKCDRVRRVRRKGTASAAATAILG